MEPASIDRLPIELLQLVFLWACHDGDGTEYSLQINSECSLPFHHTLLQVCRRWKVEATSCSSLWSSVALIYSPGRKTIPSPLQLRHYRRHLQMALVLSRNRSIDSRIAIEREPVDGVMEIVQDLVATSRRWRSLHCHINVCIPADVFLPLRNNLPRLQSMYFLPFFHGESYGDFLQVFSDAPNLVSVSFDIREASYFSLPWHNLRKFEIVESIDIPFDEQFISYFTTAASSIHLETLVCDVIEDEEFQILSTTQPVRPVICPSLREINVVDPKLLAFLTTPQLWKITIRVLTPELITTYTDLFSRSRCNVREVELEYISWARMQPLCAYLPHLGKLIAIASDLPGAAILDALPNLKYLKITLPDTAPAPQLLDAAWDIVLHSHLKYMKINMMARAPDVATFSLLSQGASFRNLKTIQTPVVKLEVPYDGGFESSIRDHGTYDILHGTWGRWRDEEDEVID